ncbi:SDR family NAD(P)-dependent oxidoreductase [Nakamurella sp. YIM 132087]|uniref:SDR family NAD(P)-dependent oxidoreductase n=1 Tax=Nakamurella alba TaxID=2665158 RepID=A0A7K1FFP9_9ACTN|nr:oxidoreductase [Nakamurella alba]MTD12932.1 SDR family NAD(P)-dependent oxidoreductase [Nakamurella alba]
MAERVWMITGASSGFGRSIAEAALAAGDTVVAAVRRPDSMADLEQRYPGRVGVVALDVTDATRIPAAVQEVLAAHGRIDVLVNNAGRGLVGAVEETTDEELRGLMELHFFGPVALTRAVLPSMRARGSGAVVQMSSQGGRLSFPGVGGYSATKFALAGWSEALAGEVAGFGIRVLVVEPGAFRTSFNGPQALLVSAGMPEYDDQIAPVRDGLAGGDGQQPGDPDKAAAAILTALAAERTPLHLVVGSDAVAAVSASMDRTRAELDEWAGVGRGADIA